MNKYIILCVDDEREVLDSVQSDLEFLNGLFDLEVTESAQEAQEVVGETLKENRKISIVLCDHIMPDILGVDFLISLNQNEYTKGAKKILLTGLADQEATIKAVNNADLDHYIAKPWKKEELNSIVIHHLTNYMIDYEEDLISYAKILDGPKIFKAIHDKGLF